MGTVLRLSPTLGGGGDCFQPPETSLEPAIAAGEATRAPRGAAPPAAGPHAAAPASRGVPGPHGEKPRGLPRSPQGRRGRRRRTRPCGLGDAAPAGEGGRRHRRLPGWAALPAPRRPCFQTRLIHPRLGRSERLPRPAGLRQKQRTAPLSIDLSLPISD